MSSKPLVSIICITFNQAQFIRKALDSFIMQKTEFEFEIIIHDDASTDGTKQIIEEYAKKYPSIIKSIYELTNVYSTGDYTFINETFQKAQGDFVAFCEGDDYWTATEKLQTQVDYLNKHPHDVLCFHPVVVKYENSSIKDEVYPSMSDSGFFTVENLLRQNFIQSNSVLYRRQDYSSLPSNVIPSDWYMHLYHAQFGTIGFINKPMSVYRRHENGVWWGSQRKNRDVLWQKHGKGHFALFAELLRLFDNNKKLRKIVLESIYWMFQTLTPIDTKYHMQIVSETIHKYPEIAEPYILKLQEMQKEAAAVLKGHQDHIKYLDAVIVLKDDEIKSLNQKIDNSLESKIKRSVKKFRNTKK